MTRNDIIKGLTQEIDEFRATNPEEWKTELANKILDAFIANGLIFMQAPPPEPTTSEKT